MYCVHREVSHGYETKVQLEYTLANYIAIPVLLYYIAATHSFQSPLEFSFLGGRRRWRQLICFFGLGFRYGPSVKILGSRWHTWIFGSRNGEQVIGQGPNCIGFEVGDCFRIRFLGVFSKFPAYRLTQGHCLGTRSARSNVTHESQAIAIELVKSITKNGKKLIMRLDALKKSYEQTPVRVHVPEQTFFGLLLTLVGLILDFVTNLTE